MTYDFGAHGVLGGGHIGYNYAFGPLVLGLEGDVEGSSLRGSQISPAYGVNYTSDTTMNFDASIRGRVGYAFDRILIYATGGAAFGNVHTNYGCEGCVVLASGLSSIDNGRWGWTAGGGLEYAVTDHVSVDVEYRYTDLGEITKVAPSPVVAIFHDNKFTSNAVRFGASYHF